MGAHGGGRGTGWIQISNAIARPLEPILLPKGHPFRTVKGRRRKSKRSWL